MKERPARQQGVQVPEAPPEKILEGKDEKEFIEDAQKILQT
jgi:hypothetical protein